MKNLVDPCVFGSGVFCGVNIKVDSDCSVEIHTGTVILPSGKIIHVPEKKFRHYKLTNYVDEPLRNTYLKFLKLQKPDEHYPEFFELADESSDPDTVDSIKEQHPGDIPQNNFLLNKIMTLYVKEDTEANDANPGKKIDKSNENNLFFVLVSRDAIARAMGIEGLSSPDSGGLFSKQIVRKEIDLVTIDAFLRPVLNISKLPVRRFGYKQLAIIKPAQGLEEENLQNPFTHFNSFKELFIEYKLIVDEQFNIFEKELEKLHFYFGSLLSHKEKTYLEKFRKVLIAKLQLFYSEGEHLYYIQYFYDWLVDLVKAYDELCKKLDGFFTGCPCQQFHTRESEYTRPSSILLLGPVIGGSSTYQPLVFRDLIHPALADDRIREVRCLHWRMLMMIWTFDLPFLKLDRVLGRYGFDAGLEEKLDSTNYWEYLNSILTDDPPTEFNWLPIKLTPTKAPDMELGHQAIPYYYPLDSNSIYSLHQFWDYAKTKMRQTDQHLSYNAHEGDEDKPSSDLVNDSYTDRKEVIMPWLYNLREYPFMKVEGHIGKQISFTNDPGSPFYFKTFDLKQYILKYNICVDVIAVGLGGAPLITSPLMEVPGLEHRQAMEQGQTLVLFYVVSDEQIELQECNKDETPEVGANTIVADFILPYRYSCCPSPILTVSHLVNIPLINNL